LFGVDVFLHNTWFFVVLYAVAVRGHEYSSYLWNVLEVIALFAIVLMHEFGHALACKQVGGQANQIVLWPLGGVAYVAPPQRPGATLWSIAAGPLVNVALLPILGTLWFCSVNLGWPDSFPNLHTFLRTILMIDISLFIFNMLPFYPLDGGQILRSLLWYLFGRATSLIVAASIGFVGVAGLGLLAVMMFLGSELVSGLWLGMLAAFMGLNCLKGIQYGQNLSRLEKAPRRAEFSCPACHETPPVGEFWGCGRCRKTFDTFLTQGFCPNCNAEYSVAACPFCHSVRPMADWRAFVTPSTL
jgi:Zn-dependent protease